MVVVLVVDGAGCFGGVVGVGGTGGIGGGAWMIRLPPFQWALNFSSVKPRTVLPAH